MAISVNAAVSAYMPQQAYSPPAATSVQASAQAIGKGGTGQPASTLPEAGAPPEAGTQANSRSRSQTNPSNTSATQGQRAQNARKKSPAAQLSARPGYSFTVDLHNHRIMKVSDSKGVLIYQVPSKGQLALITAQEDKQKLLKLTA